jgi:hydrogenase nickel incorporation protein HypB
MCDTCGCGQPGDGVRIIKPGAGKDDHSHGHDHTYSHTHPHTHEGQEHEHEHTHGYSHEHEVPGRSETDHSDLHKHEHAHSHNHDNLHHHDHNHDHVHPDDDDQIYKEGRRLQIEQDVLGKNKLIAERNRGYFEALNLFTLNLVSSPGSGKTSLIERTIREMKGQFPLFIIEGDQQTMNDSERIYAAGAPVVQVNTGQGCHLDAEMVSRAMRELNLTQGAILMIENVGNLVCPALFDLGEARRVVIMSVTEGEDKPVKYPYMFRSADLCILNKTDLLPYLDFDLNKAREYAGMVNPGLEIIELSVKSGEGMEQWYQWLKMTKNS